MEIYQRYPEKGEETFSVGTMFHFGQLIEQLGYANVHRSSNQPTLEGKIR